MTMTTTAAQELLRGDAQIEAPPVGGRKREASATLAHLHSLFFDFGRWAANSMFTAWSNNKSFTHGFDPILESPFETIQFSIQENAI